MIGIIVSMLLSFFIIAYIIFKFNKFNLCYSVSKKDLKELIKVNDLINKANNSTKQEGGEDNITFKDICLSALDNCISKNNILESWINDIRNKKSVELFNNLKEDYNDDIENIEKNVSQINTWVKVIEKINEDLKKNNVTPVPFEKPNSEILKFEKDPFLKEKYNKIDTIKEYEQLDYKEWNDEIYNDGKYLDGEKKANINEKFEKEINDFNKITNTDSDLYKDLEKSYKQAEKEAKEHQGTMETAFNIGTQQGGGKKYHYYEPKKIRNDKIVKRILKNLK